MKHIGACLDNIQILLGGIPKNIDSPQDKDKAIRIVDEVEEYANTLAQLVTNPNLRDYLAKLEKEPINGIQMQAHEVENLLKELMHILYLLDLYIQNLRDIIANHPEQWRTKAENLVLTIAKKFNDEQGNLHRVFKIVLYEQRELEQIVTSENHLAEFLR